MWKFQNDYNTYNQLKSQITKGNKNVILYNKDFTEHLII